MNGLFRGASDTRIGSETCRIWRYGSKNPRYKRGPGTPRLPDDPHTCVMLHDVKQVFMRSERARHRILRHRQAILTRDSRVPVLSRRQRAIRQDAGALFMSQPGMTSRFAYDVPPLGGRLPFPTGRPFAK